MASRIQHKKSEQLLTAGVEEVIERQSLEKKLLSGKKLVVKFGADPSRPDLHLGHALVLRKLKEFQDLGHKTVFIIGDFTARIGDPSGRATAREPLADGEIQKNSKTYFEQVGKILDLDKVEIRYNSEWFSEMRLAAFLPTAARFSLRRLIDREDFQKRIRAGEEVTLCEGLYQVLQAYDSAAVKADVELGGRDQRLNILAGRELQKKMGQPPQDVMIVPLLIGLDGQHKMSKSLKNYVAFNDPPEEAFGKIMSIPDSMILHYAELAAFLDGKELRSLGALVRRRPFQAKLSVAGSIVKLYWGREKAELAQRAFSARFSRRGEKEAVYSKKEVFVKTQPLLDAVVALGGANSRSDARRLILGKAVEVDGIVVCEPGASVDFSKPRRFRIGKKIFVKASFCEPAQRNPS